MIEEDFDSEQALSNLPDPVSMAVGSGHYVQNHRMNVQINVGGGKSPRLRVSRYYWDLRPPVAIDFVNDIQLGPLELATKKAYFAEVGTRYVLAKDAFDGETVEATLQAQVPEGEAPPITKASDVLVGPRRKRDQ